VITPCSDPVVDSVMAGGHGAAGPAIRDEQMEGRRLAEDVVLLTYVSDAAGRRARRTSLWRFHEGHGWRLLHHQGTLFSEVRGTNRP